MVFAQASNILKTKSSPYQRHSLLLFFFNKKIIIEVYFSVKPIKPLRIQSRTSIANKTWLGQGTCGVEQTDSSMLLLLVYSLSEEEKGLFSTRLPVYINTDKFRNSIGGNNSIKHAFHRITKTSGFLARRRLVSQSGHGCGAPWQISERLRMGLFATSKSTSDLLICAYFIF